MSLTRTMLFHCPYCMEPNEIEVDETSDINVMQVIDCQVCCQPIEMTVTGDSENLTVDVKQENE
ncbi:CPXCG motif-containing cysteine-rich protein [Alteromonas sp. C1M14]|uniref:CPXCG motif-containing cysteine-rich protein n=1 Tax=Alteromonas sp. C1M14 TaxID=2841567 RepID=UPI001C08E906|nr:CPXCG motif-containing cysteine-rich protein [Alteromonas sp. C1M14]MBU2978288.1 CPXCG motif-containing cysteine-rich protein [Alteromonas sp. C1M14]